MSHFCRRCRRRSLRRGLCHNHVRVGRSLPRRRRRRLRTIISSLVLSHSPFFVSFEMCQFCNFVAFAGAFSSGACGRFGRRIGRLGFLTVARLAFISIARLALISVAWLPFIPVAGLTFVSVACLGFLSVGRLGFLTALFGRFFYLPPSVGYSFGVYGRLFPSLDWPLFLLLGWPLFPSLSLSRSNGYILLLGRLPSVGRV